MKLKNLLILFNYCPKCYSKLSYFSIGKLFCSNSKCKFEYKYNGL